MRYKGTSENPEKTDKRTKSQNYKATNGQMDKTQKIKVKAEGPIVFVFYALLDRQRKIENKA